MWRYRVIGRSDRQSDGFPRGGRDRGAIFFCVTTAHRGFECLSKAEERNDYRRLSSLLAFPPRITCDPVLREQARFLSCRFLPFFARFSEWGDYIFLEVFSVLFPLDEDSEEGTLPPLDERAVVV